MTQDKSSQDRSSFDVPAQLSAMRRYARSLTRSENDAEDLVQDALVRAYEKRGSFEPVKADQGRGLRVWLLSVLHNAFIDRRRSRIAEQRRAAQAAELTDVSTPPAQELHVRLAQVREAFLDLPEEQRAALHLVAIEGLGYAEAAAALGIPQGTLMSRLSRARATLRALEDGTRKAVSTSPASALPALAPPAATPSTGRGPHLRIVGGADEPSS
jgi:RNA polymerase sigma-70 factor (ECF subfamily)